MKLLLLVFLGLSGSLFAAAPADVSSEARALFTWFEALGYPDLRTADWVEAAVESPRGTKPREVQAFLLREDEETLFLLTPDLSPRVMGRNGSLRWEKKPLLDRVSKLVEEVRKASGEPVEAWQERPDFRMGTAGRTFLMAYACWAKGYPAEAQRLFDAAEKVPSPFVDQPEAGDLRKVIEAELAHAATWEAFLDFGEAGDVWDGQRPQSISREQLLRKFEEIEKRFPANPHGELVKDVAERLHRMVEEDRNHPPLTREQIAKLPVDEQVAEWVFQLRDQNGRQMFQPGSCDVFASLLVDSGTSPAHRLVEIGFPAVPQLIAALDDERLSRSVNFSRRQFFSHRPLTVGECAQQVLNLIARRIFPSSGVCSDPEDRRRLAAKYRGEVTAWWNDAREKGETASLEEFVSAGQGFAVTAIERLRKLDPAACEKAVLAGAQASGGDTWYLEALCHPDTPARRAGLQELMRTAPNLSSRALAATRLRQKLDESASAAMLEEWIKFPSGTEPADQEGFETLARFLIAGGEPSALQAIEASWPKLSPRKKAGILRILGENLSTKERIATDWGREKPPAPEAVAAAHQIFRAALEDPAPAAGFGLSGWNVDLGQYQFSDPRLCDYAVFALKQSYPRSVTWKSGADEPARASELSAAKKFLETAR